MRFQERPLRTLASPEPPANAQIEATDDRSCNSRHQSYSGPAWSHKMMLGILAEMRTAQRPDLGRGTRTG